LFEALIVGTYARRLASYAGETLKVEGVLRQNEKMAAVSSRVIRPKGQPIPIYWRLRRGKDDWRIVDVVVEGVSMALTQRAEFNAVIKRNGGRIEGLLEKLRETTARSRGRPAEQVEASL
ncbi:MAG: ABC transporter substrate-binding protein, partial [Kiloniellaceae bacterium]